MTSLLSALGFAYIHDAPAHVELDGPLLRRWVLVTPLGTLRLHHLCAPDVAHYHDHPWSFASVVVRGWYAEEFPDSSILRRGPGSVGWRSSRVLHRIAAVAEGGAWTLVATGPKRKSWGFLQGGSWAPWRTVVGPAETQAAARALLSSMEHRDA